MSASVTWPSLPCAGLRRARVRTHGPFHLGGGRKQIAFALLPVAALSLVAVCCGVAAVKRRPADRWVSALAVAGTVVGAIVLLMVVTGILVSWINDPVGNTD